MFSSLSAAALAALLLSARACPDAHDHDHAHAKRIQPDSTNANAWPTRPLEWGDLNFLHTTDTHGWLLGHTKSSDPEPNASGDFGDFASFVIHLKAEALRRGADFLLLDSGDLHDGNGLSDVVLPGGVDGHESNKFFAQLPYDVLTPGNHELYIYENARDMWDNFLPQFHGRYLSSNVNLTVNGISKPFGSRFAKFRTLLGRKVTAFGVLYDFTESDAGIDIQPVAQMVQEQWFKDAIKEEPEFFLLVGHMPLQKNNWPLVIDAIRAVHPSTPIFVFGGHSHIRDCAIFDSRTIGIQSGRYMETVGWMSVKLPKKHDTTSALQFSRRYLDPNRNTYAFHTSAHGTQTQNLRAFDTPKGLKITKGLTALAEKLNMTYNYGTVPQDYYMTRVQYPDPSSVVTLFINEVVPTVLRAANPDRASIPNVIVVNAGTQRFDVFKGPFTLNDAFIVSPFYNTFVYIPDVPFSIAKQVGPLLNSSGLPSKRDLFFERTSSPIPLHELDTRSLERADVDEYFEEWTRDMWERFTADQRRDELTLGYVTTDTCPGEGDDTPHAAIPVFKRPPFVWSPFPSGVADEDTVDLVFTDFIQNQTLTILDQIAPGQWSAANIAPYTDASLTVHEVFLRYAELAWKQDP
ncbi:hypothetical protein EXIGLDRAFT_829355 [Exidia glandulosa HHB12029]|uniref:Uncharacterized protein n=1 Tax=Exidia glandulosa HHB12029 TaxID=1314781 RepID=A0A165PPH6_EXIGL|nr:hypothetical protein EXIGLDRAFT_829355 [Exidia glandulosa HHB12029]